MQWMAWTPVTAAFFVTIVLILVGMTVWQMASPSVARKGFLPIETHRGDRLFISLLGSAFIHLAWLTFTETPVTGIPSATLFLGVEAVADSLGVVTTEIESYSDAMSEILSDHSVIGAFEIAIVWVFAVFRWG
ncbi:DUF2160 domain-containing protein [Aestuariispira ectoiniformans]|uniref:DUF2160 domain-containing protein n=1 Tax=Aestuariispira ectoiniformans TaxID=2775080 RepID=UPI00223C4EA6|nr:DUF2160 domain-containing protein [Aestuariispira ectoiniformans]